MKLLKNRIAFCIFVFISIQMNAQNTSFPYMVIFNSTEDPNDYQIPPSGEALTPNGATFTKDGLQLTPAEQNKFGAVIVKDLSFDITKGLAVEFEFVIDSQNTASGTPVADGMSFFLYDGNELSPTIGGFGGALAYTYNRSTDFPGLADYYRRPGLKGAYLGIGFDAYQNFKIRRQLNYELKQGLPYSSQQATNPINGHVTLRGAEGVDIEALNPGNKKYKGMKKGYTGYPLLLSQPLGKQIAIQNLNAFVLEQGQYVQKNLGYSGNFVL